MTIFQGLATVAAALLITQTAEALWICFDTADAPCGTPIATANLALVVAPLVLTLPFIKLLWVKGLPAGGLVARCAVTASIAVWVGALATLQWTHLWLI